MGIIRNVSSINNEAQLEIPCIVCGETVPLTENEKMLVCGGHIIQSQMCDKCKKAVLFIRERLEGPAIVLD